MRLVIDTILKAQTMILLATALCITVSSLPDPGDCFNYVEALQDPAADIQSRHQAEDSLRHCPPTILPAVFQSLDDSVDSTDGAFHPTNIGAFPGTGSPDSDAMILPVGAQVVYARHRVWEHLSRNAEPAEERRRVLASLFPLAESHMQQRALLQSLSAQNWSPEIEHAVGAWLIDRSQPYDIRASAARSLVSRNHKQWRETVLQEAWLLRAESLEGAFRIAAAATPLSGDSRFPYDARYAALIAENFDRVRKTQSKMAGAAAATTLGNYIKVKFTPALESPIEWQSEAWYAAIVANASDWADAHRAELEADAARAARDEQVENRFQQPGFVSSHDEVTIRAAERNRRRMRELQDKD